MRNSIQHKNNVIDCKLFSEATLLFLHREFMWIVYLECLNTIRLLIYKLDFISGSTTLWVGSLWQNKTQKWFPVTLVSCFFVIKKLWLDFLIWFDPDIELESWTFLLARNHWSHILSLVYVVDLYIDWLIDIFVFSIWKDRLCLQSCTSAVIIWY